MIHEPLCEMCTHIDDTPAGDGTRIPTCEAFPGGIPAAIYGSEVLHIAPIDGDNGVIFEAEDGLQDQASAKIEALITVQVPVGGDVDLTPWGSVDTGVV